MTKSILSMTRRSFLTAATLAPIHALGSFYSGIGEHHFHYDHVVGTSMDLVVWSRNAAAADRAELAARAEIERLISILDTRNPESEISRLGNSTLSTCSYDLGQVFAQYDYWERQTNGALSLRPLGAGTPRNVDALGKAYIIDRAVAAARDEAPGLTGLLLNIGGDIVAWGNTPDIEVADPLSPHDNGSTISKIALRNYAIATSGTVARGGHLIDARTGQTGLPGASATVLAPDAVTANALSTTLCVISPKEGLELVKATDDAEGLIVEPGGVQWRTSGFASWERPRVIPIAAVADWPMGYELAINFTLTAGQSAFGGRGGGPGPFGGRGLPPQFVAVWIENPAGKLVRVLGFWANNKTRYYSELSSFFALMGQNQNQMYSIARATRRPGAYSFVWDGLDDQHKAVPPGSYKVVIETNQEHGTYGKQAGTIMCGDAPSSLTLPATANFEQVGIQYGPRQNRA